MYFLISYNRWDIRLKPMQKEPSWKYVLHFVICFPHFSFSAIWQACFHVRQKLVSLHNHSISQALFRFAKKCHGQVFKQLWNHSFIFNSYEIIHSLPALSCCWSKPWSHCKLVSYFAFKCWNFSNKRDQNIEQITGTERELLLNKHAPKASLLFEPKTVPFQSRINDDIREVHCWEFWWYGLIITYYATSLQESVDQVALWSGIELPN